MGLRTIDYADKLHALRKARGGHCEDCNKRLAWRPRRRIWNLEFAHVKPTGLSGEGRGLRQRYMDIKRNPECYALLCWFCHKKRDNKPLPDYPPSWDDECIVQ